MPSWPVPGLTVVRAFFGKVRADCLATFATPALLNSRIVPVHRGHKRIMAGMRPHNPKPLSHDKLLTSNSAN